MLLNKFTAGGGWGEKSLGNEVLQGLSLSPDWIQPDTLHHRTDS